MLWDKTTAILVIQQTTLEVYLRAVAGYVKLAFPPAMVSSQDVVQPENFIALISEFLHKHVDGKHRVLIVLTDDVLYQKHLTVRGETDGMVQAQAFFESLPWSLDVMVTQIITKGESWHLLAANSVLFEAVRQAAAKAGWKVTGIVPMAIYADIVPGKILTHDTVELILSHPERINIGDFSMMGNPQEPWSGWHFKVLVLLLAVALVSLVGIVLVLITRN